VFDDPTELWIYVACSPAYEMPAIPV